MLKKILFSLVIAIVTLGSAAAQSATIKGKILGDDGKPLESATVKLMQEGRLIRGDQTDSRGDYSLSPIAAGTYDLVVSYSMLPPTTLKGIVVKSSEIKILDDIKISQTLDPVIIEYKPEMFTKDVAKRDDYNGDDLKVLPSRKVDDLIASSGGVGRDQSGNIVVRAQREPPRYYVDGVPTSSPPAGAIGSISLISGALPPEYGDGGSVIEIETKGPSSKVKTDIYLSTYVDGHDYAYLEATSLGPIVKAKSNGFSMSYLLNVGAEYGRGPILWKGYYRASQETIDFLKENPFRPTNDMAVSRYLDYVTKYRSENTSSAGEQQGTTLMLEEKRARQMQNAWSTSVRVRPKIDIRTPSNMDFSIGGHFAYNTGRSASFTNTLFNSENNAISEGMTVEVNARFTHRIGGKTAESGNKQIIKNAFYRLQGYYIHSSSKAYSHIHKDNLFDYGYVGKFEHFLRPAYEPGEVIDTNGDIWAVKYKQVTVPRPYMVEFTPSDVNSALAQYATSVQDLFGGFLPNDELLMQSKGLRNGDIPSDAAYGLFTAPGVPYDGYGNSFSDRVGGKALVSFEIGDHAIRFGFDYDQVMSHSYSIRPGGLWTLMRQKTNSHISELNFDDPDFIFDEGGNFTDYVNYPRLIDKNSQTDFDYNLREKLKKDYPGKFKEDTWIDIDTISPSYFDLSMFSPEELFNGGTGFRGESSLSLSYSGYDYLGKKAINRTVTMTDMENWFNEGDPNNKRDFSQIGASKPVKMAAYIQDQFSIKTLYVMLGLRLDIFNVNQPCVNDMFLYRKALTVKEAQNSSKLGSDMIPEFMKMSDDFYVYLRELKDANDQIYAEDIVAYRNGKTWYNKDGQIVTDPEALAKEAGINQLMPYLEKAPGKEDITKVNYKAFSEYTPTFANGGVTLSPRIAFSFAVGEQSLFSASYNVITSWSAAAQSLNPVAYLFFKENAAKSNYTFSNPGLKPERSVNYEVGFKQLINKDMSMEFAAYYSERKDQVVAYQYSQAYPNTYISYTNMDFGTVQGFILGLNMRAGEKKRASFRANYTLQFAKGTGSDRNSTLELLRSGQPNLRQLTTLNADQRHKVNLIFTYVFGPGDGPTNRAFNKKKGTLKEYKLLQNAGVAVQLGAGSGLPYTRSSTPYSTIISNQGKRSVEGAINGSRMPWLIDGDIRIFKGFVITLKKDDKGKIVKTGDIQVALSIQNVIGYKNETFVYSYSGKRIDDGYLTAREFQQYITTRENPASFIDYYTILMEGTNPYGAPRTFKVDVSFSF